MMHAFHDSADWTRRNFQRRGLDFTAQLERVLAAARAAGAAIILVGEPCADQVLRDDEDHGIALYHQEMERLAAAPDVQYVDFPGLLMERRSDFLFVDSVHLNEHGHRLLADALAGPIADGIRSIEEVGH